MCIRDRFAEQLDQYTNTPDAAASLTDVGEQPTPDDVNEIELAAWTQVARAILNVYETTSRF